jgi:hypothetical protein
VGCTVTNGYGHDFDNPGGGINGGSASNCTLSGNSATFGGAAYGGTLYNCTLSGNSSTEGGGAAYGGTLVNSISWGNNKEDDSVTESYSCGVGYSGTGSITNDPQFVGSGDYRLQAGSPCINVGTNGAWTVGAKDLDGKDRIYPVGGTVDMGAYEWSPALSKVIRMGGSSIFKPGGASIFKPRGTIE